MKKAGRQIMKMVNHLSNEIRWRYPNLYQFFEDAENPSMERTSMRVSDYVNRKRVS